MDVGKWLPLFSGPHEAVVVLLRALLLQRLAARRLAFLQVLALLLDVVASLCDPLLQSATRNTHKQLSDA